MQDSTETVAMAVYFFLAMSQVSTLLQSFSLTPSHQGHSIGLRAGLIANFTSLPYHLGVMLHKRLLILLQKTYLS